MIKKELGDIIEKLEAPLVWGTLGLIIGGPTLSYLSREENQPIYNVLVSWNTLELGAYAAFISFGTKLLMEGIDLYQRNQDNK